LYFLTLQVVGWAAIFTRQFYRDIIIDSFVFCRKSRGLKVYSYVIMSNHIHCIVSANDNLSDVIRDLKKFTDKEILKAIGENIQESRKGWLLMIFKYQAKFNKRVKKFQFWTHENHTVELTSIEMIESRVNYIHQNPVRAGDVAQEHEYIYSSAKNFAGQLALMEIDEL
jgi:REP element-mobilizing transposase RayT